MRNIMKNAMPCRIFAALLCVGFALAAGCGGEAQQSKDKDFFTSGNREADQRADERMAQKQELTGDTANAGGTVTKSQAVLANEKKPLYDRVGGSVGIKLIVDDFVTRAMADPRVNLQRVGIKRGGFSIHHNQSMEWDASADNVAALKLHLAEFIGLSTGGPSKYTGEDLKDVVKNMHYTNPNFDAAMGDLKATLDKLQIANQEQKELLSVMETTREQVVEDR
jgi:hemoglobin